MNTDCFKQTWKDTIVCYEKKSKTRHLAFSFLASSSGRNFPEQYIKTKLKTTDSILHSFQPPEWHVQDLLYLLLPNRWKVGIPLQEHENDRRWYLCLCKCNTELLHMNRSSCYKICRYLLWNESCSDDRLYIWQRRESLLWKRSLVCKNVSLQGSSFILSGWVYSITGFVKMIIVVNLTSPKPRVAF